MKQFYLLLFLLPIFVVSCDKIKDANTIDLNTSIEMVMGVNVENPSAVLVKSAADFAFSESATASLYDSPEIVDYLDKIKTIEVENIEVEFMWLDPNVIINTITLSVSGVGDIVTLTDVSAANAIHNPTISSSVLNQVAAKLENEWSITATVAGTTNTAPVWFEMYVTYDLKVEAEAL